MNVIIIQSLYIKEGIYRHQKVVLSPTQTSICIARYELVRIEVCLRKQLYRTIWCNHHGEYCAIIAKYRKISSHDILILSEFFNPYDPDKTERRPVMLQKTPIGNGEYSYKVFASLRVSFRYGMDQSDQF